MVFERIWDASCPRVWDSWDGADGVKWVIRDLPPEDDEDAIKIMLEHWCTDEPLYKYNDVVNDPFSIKVTTKFWKECLHKRMSLGCYEERNSNSRLVALNICTVLCQDDSGHDQVEEESQIWINVFKALMLCENGQDPFQLLGMDKIVKSYGLVVHRDYRGLGLASRILSARKPLALHLGVNGTVTLFTGPASQKCAERAGFTTVSTTTWKDFAEAGLDYPPDETKCLKVMMKKYI